MMILESLLVTNASSKRESKNLYLWQHLLGKLNGSLIKCMRSCSGTLPVLKIWPHL